MKQLTNPELLTVNNSRFKSDADISGTPSCYECSINPERRKVTVKSAVEGSVQDVKTKYFIPSLLKTNHN